jgi:hypothetical protein
MKQAKKLWSLLLAFVLVLSLTNGFTAKADTTDTATSITVTLRVEQDDATLVAPVKITLTDEDKKSFGIGLSTDTLTPLHALAKYMEQYANATDETMDNYIYINAYGYLSGISKDGKISGENPDNGTSSSGNDNCYWMYKINNQNYLIPDSSGYIYGMGQYPLKDSDSITFYGLWYEYGSLETTNYTYFDKESYEAETNKELSVQLKGLGYDDTIEQTITEATVVATPYSESTTAATEKNATISQKVDSNGKVSLKFDKAGTYVLSAYRKAEDGKHITISRPYAIVTVTDAKTEGKKEDEQPAAAVEPTNVDTVTPTQQSTAKMPAQVKGLKKTISKKFKKKKKTVTLTWKKTTNATSYQIYISKKKNSGYKKTATTKGLKKALKLKKGTYYVKVRAYNKSGYFYKYGKFSNVVKIKIKK